MTRLGTTAETTTLVEPTPMAASWPARTWTPAERVTAGMMNTIRDQLNELHSGATATESNVNVVIRKSLPAVELWHTGNLAPGRFLLSGNATNMSDNLTNDGANWMRDDVSKPSSLYQMYQGTHYWYNVAAGANPAAVVQLANLGSAGLTTLVPIKNTVGGNSLGDLTCAATNFTVAINVTGAGASTFAGPIYGAQYIYSAGVMYPGRIDNGAAQTSWYLASHGSYGLYSNTGIYCAGPVYSASLLQGIQAPRVVGLGAGASSYQHNCSTADMVTHYAIAVGCTFYNPLNPVDGLQFIIALRDQGTAMPLAWGATFYTCGPTPIPTATPGGGKSMYLVFRYCSYINVWFMLAVTSQQ